MHPKEPYEGVKVTRDLKYGPDARNVLDVFTPENLSGPARVMIFIHGGGYVGGNKRGAPGSPGEPFYDNFMLFAAKNGMVGVNATYRLAPANRWPACLDDTRASVSTQAKSLASLESVENEVRTIALAASSTTEMRRVQSTSRVMASKVVLMSGG